MMQKFFSTFMLFYEKNPLEVIILIITLCVLVLFLAVLLGRTIGKLESKASLSRFEKFSRQDAVKRSRSVLLGQLGEQLSPFLPGFPCSPEDARFIGKPVDFIAFSGMGAGEDGEGGTIKEIVFIEVKTGNAVLSKREREIKKAVEEGRVRYIEYRIGS